VRPSAVTEILAIPAYGFERVDIAGSALSTGAENFAVFG
jgi:hypothetical protein